MCRMRKRIIALLMVVIMGVPFAGWAEFDAAKIEKELADILNDANSPISGLSVLAIKNGQTVYEKTMGFRYIDAENPTGNLTIDKDTRFRIASISKVFTAIAMFQFEEQEKIDLDGDISDYVGFTLRNPSYPDAIITPRMLLSHTSSIRDGSVYSIPPESGIVEFFTSEGKYWNNGEHFATPSEGDCIPGKYFAYSNLNYGVLGTVVERISGVRFDKFMKANIMEPMGLKASYNPGDFDAETIANVSVLYQKKNKGIWDKTGPYIAQIDDYRGELQPQDVVLITNPDLQAENVLADLSDYEIGTNGTLFSPQGGLRISTAELERVMYMFLKGGVIGDKKILTKESVDAMFTPFWRYDEALKNGNTYWGLMDCYCPGVQMMTGKFLDKFVENREIVMSGHFGEAYGLLAGMFLDRESGDGILYIMNGMGAPEDDNAGKYSGMYRWEEKFCTALLDNVFPEK